MITSDYKDELSVTAFFLHMENVFGCLKQHQNVQKDECNQGVIPNEGIKGECTPLTLKKEKKSVHSQHL